LIAFSLFIYFSLLEVGRIIAQPGYISVGARKVISASAFGAIGLILGGKLRYTGSSSRSPGARRSSRADPSTTHLTSQALLASQAPVAITDLQRRVLMVNPSFELLTGYAVGEAELNTLLEEVLQQDEDDDIIRVMMCYEDYNEGEDEFLVGDRVVRVKVSPSPFSDAESAEPGATVVVVLRDMSCERALEEAVETAHEHALRTRAIMAAIEALTRQMQIQVAPQPQVGQMFDVIPDDDDVFENG
jgi:PAS domain S-box-containing protein